MSDEFSRAMVHISTKRSRVKIPMVGVFTAPKYGHLRSVFEYRQDSLHGF